MTGHRTLTAHIRARAAETPDREALILLTERDGGLRPETVTYAELDRAARTLAGRLRRHVRPGDRVLIAPGSRALFVTGFLACLYTGAVAVPVAPPGGRGHHDERIAGIVKDAAAACLITSVAEAAEASQLLARTGHGDVVCLLADGPAPAGAAPGQDVEPHAAEPDEPVYLQYTSGSTREPRGVVVTHRSLLANQRAIREALGTRPGIRMGGWLPLHHDMGLAGQLLHALWLGGTAVLLSPAAFVKRPANWLETVSRYGLTVSGAPDFAYDLCVRRINDSQIAALDLSRWEVAVSGGEPVDAATLKAFAERFAPAGLRPGALAPCYGLAEATLLVSGTRTAPAAASRTVDAAALEAGRLVPAPAGTGRVLTHCGPPASADVRIVDPETRRELPDGRIGEIWVRGESIGPGYRGRPAETAASFGCRIEGGGSGYLRTGDLGALDDGLLYVTGRIKDMIIFAGRNLYPQDLERTVQQVSGLFGAATAFAVPDSRERIVIVQELRARSRYDIDLAALAAAVQQRLSQEYEVKAGAVLLVRPGTVRRTTSGKVERAAMRRLFLRGELTPLHQRLDSDVERLLAAGRAR
ncbi:MULTISPECIES: fatty acyl-AMP ligase [Streptomyces]|uniref:Acyl-CoA synthetase (AMP-forming)/AMP-acid ligase II n=1 Tax=Streptomyces clavifer TaxID=68188 RepID=A0ABS4V583_9ACTN|nr:MULTISPECIES: fatty acyl-AMP ligase [Streptomyces]KQX81100.1 polyketide synthase [Streptomyces sp. Root1319]KQZ06922.1 polyketide synthase [Streptomyces sp. Root55]MBP2359067.1 acyl-CoA synthetase (AMP-forming)/AMP-acid ligase II [Streptomyces clavifer]MDX2745743.1 fatty acyl-AMP ligase [Streptomyces sp. NRRL_B-2557]RPK81331.1 Long-chain-fatty-acid--AMP ligase FadD29 [Streptomyces sp. ADI97-07]